MSLGQGRIYEVVGGPAGTGVFTRVTSRKNSDYAGATSFCIDSHGTLVVKPSGAGPIAANQTFILKDCVWGERNRYDVLRDVLPSRRSGHPSISTELTTRARNTSSITSG